MKRIPVLLIGLLSITQACGNSAGAGAGDIMSVLTVNGQSGFKSAIHKAKAGDTIILKEGNYGDVVLKNLNFSAPVTIVSEDASSAALFKSILMVNVHNVTFKSVEVNFVKPANVGHAAPAISVMKSSGVTFDTVDVHGSLNNNPVGDGYGLTVLESKNINVLNSEFQQFFRGFVFYKTDNITFKNNDVHDIRAIASVFTDVNHVVIDNNRIYDIYPVGEDHPDAIQFHTRGADSSSTNVVITNNVIMQGHGRGMQGIFLTDQIGTFPYKDVLIKNNLVYIEGYYNGITVHHGENIRIVDNTVLSPEGEKIVRIWTKDISGGLLSGNIADAWIKTGHNGVRADDNIFLLDTPGKGSLIPHLNAGANAVVADLVVSGYGYHPASGSTGGASPPKTAPGRPVTPAPDGDTAHPPTTSPDPAPPAHHPAPGAGAGAKPPVISAPAPLEPAAPPASWFEHAPVAPKFFHHAQLDALHLHNFVHIA